MSIKLTIQRDELLKPLQMVSGVVEKRQTMPILSNVLMETETGESFLKITGSDCEVELIGKSTLSTPVTSGGKITVPGRKLLDICRSLPEQTEIDIQIHKDQMVINALKNRFTLSTLPADDYPNLETDSASTQLAIPQDKLLFLAQRTHFAMAAQDVRHYLNGMQLEVSGNEIRTIATDGHRLAKNTAELENDAAAFHALIPRKGVTELLRLLSSMPNTLVNLSVSGNHIRAETDQFIFTSKLIDATFPSYDRLIPKHGDKLIGVDRDSFKFCLARASILANEKYRSIRMQLESNLLRIEANNPEQEEANIEISIDYQHPKVELGFNVDYLIDVLNVLNKENVAMTFSDSDHGVLIEENSEQYNSTFVVMPMRL